MGFKGLQPILYGGREVWPLIEGGKGVSATNHASSGAWAAAGGIGTVSAVNADSYDAEGKIIPQVYQALTRKERHQDSARAARGIDPIRDRRRGRASPTRL
jgi:nitronate monooxygenase